MACYWRTLLCGLGVSFASYLVASLSWPILLLGFAFASLSLGIWTWCNDSRQANNKAKAALLKKFGNATRRVEAKREAAVYQFPIADLSFNQISK
jgi:hypothetical protein